MPTRATAFHPAQGGRRVLVVDDDPAIRDLFGLCLRRAEFVVDLATSGEEALRCVADIRPDVMTLDLGMPDIDGFAIIDRLRALPMSPPIVVVSGHVYVEETFVFGKPVVALLSKPLQPGDLVAACERALTPTRPRDPGDLERDRWGRRSDR
jgi:CheY-like chemotaxis protein